MLPPVPALAWHRRPDTEMFVAIPRSPDVDRSASCRCKVEAQGREESIDAHNDPANVAAGIVRRYAPARDTRLLGPQTGLESRSFPLSRDEARFRLRQRSSAEVRPPVISA